MKVLFIGPLNKNNVPLGGDQYKNQLLINFLNTQGLSLTCIDTFKWLDSPFILFRLIIQIAIHRRDRILLSASSGSAYYLIRILNLFPSILRSTVYLVIGGDLPNKLFNGTYQKKYYSGLKSIVLEGKMLREKLVSMGLFNTLTIPNL